MARIRAGRSKRPKARGGEVTTRKVDSPATSQQRSELRALLERVPGMVDIPEYLKGLSRDDAQWVIVELSFPRFRRLGEEWVVIGTVDSVKPGPLEVHKRDGSSTHVQIKKVSKPFKHMDRDMVHGHIR